MRDSVIDPKTLIRKRIRKKYLEAIRNATKNGSIIIETGFFMDEMSNFEKMEREREKTNNA